MLQRVFKAFHYRDFRILWIGACTSTIGTWMQEVAQNWVNQCTFGYNPDRGDYGETILASAGGEAVTAQTIVSNWASEAADYTYSTNSCTGDTCNDYTQLVWRSTTMVGCATKQCSTGSPFGSSSPLWEFAVCDYSPPGNVDAEEPY